MLRKRWPTPAVMKQQCATWNAAYPVGQKVSVLMDTGNLVFTETVTEAQMLGGHTAVIWLNGIAGAYMLDRVKPVSDG